MIRGLNAAPPCGNRAAGLISVHCTLSKYIHYSELCNACQYNKRACPCPELNRDRALRQSAAFSIKLQGHVKAIIAFPTKSELACADTWLCERASTRWLPLITGSLQGQAGNILLVKSGRLFSPYLPGDRGNPIRTSSSGAQKPRDAKETKL